MTKSLALAVVGVWLLAVTVDLLTASELCNVSGLVESLRISSGLEMAPLYTTPVQLCGLVQCCLVIRSRPFTVVSEVR